MDELVEDTCGKTCGRDGWKGHVVETCCLDVWKGHVARTCGQGM